MPKVLITGGAGFVGANLATTLVARLADVQVISLDNLSRRGSELNLPRLRAAGVRFVHGDVRQLEDLLAVGPIDVLVECSAEPSVLAGVSGSPAYLVETNLMGAYHCLELVRRHQAQIIFLSTSRVYPVGRLSQVGLVESDTRFEIAPDQATTGVSSAGISEDFPLDGARTLYGATKLAAELLLAEYRDSYAIRTVTNRLGVIAGPWQMGKVDQGVFTYWMLAHVFNRPLRYLGYGGTGKQVRDLLHVDDLAHLIIEQIEAPEHWDGQTVNAGGGRRCSLSLRETTSLCSTISGRCIDVICDGTQRPGDIPLYISDNSRLNGLTSWHPQRSAERTLEDIHAWIVSNEHTVRSALQ